MDMIEECYRIAAEEVKKITCYDIPAPCYANPRTYKQRIDTGWITETYTYVISDGQYCEMCDTYERGIYYNPIGDTKSDMIAHLIFETVWSFAIRNTANSDEAWLISDKCFTMLDAKYNTYYKIKKAVHEKLKEKGIL